MLRILTTLYNARPYIGKCLTTIAEQAVREWRCYILNDMSTDGSEQIGGRFAEHDDRIVLINHPRKLYQVGSYLHALSRPEIADEDICLSVDGDDWLPDEFVFDRVLEAYADRSTWLTWGSMLMYHDGAVHPSDFCQPLLSWDNIRQQG
jgi:glycosyltransferase involved in cell wall biosynthesis